MNIEMLPEKVERLESVFNNILYLKPEDRIIRPNVNTMAELKTAINDIFTDNTCVDVLYTNNTDKQFFGIRISPALSGSDALVILTTDSRITLDKYSIEYDSKLFDLGLDESELAALTLYEISAMMDNPQIFEDLRGYVDYNLVTNDDVVSIRDSANAAQLIIFAIKDTMYKISSILYKTNEDLAADTFMQGIEGAVENLISAKEKITNGIIGFNGDGMRSPKPVILDWMFIMYRDITINSRSIRDTLNDAKMFTGSKLEVAEIDKCISALNRIDTYIMDESSLDLVKFLDKKNISAVNEASLFKSLKKNGLRGIENDLYEYRMRAKNCTDPDEAHMIMRSINSRIGILDDYLMNDEVSEHDAKHWQDVSNEYRELRAELAKKKLNLKQWGVFINYDALDRVYPDNKFNAE